MINAISRAAGKCSTERDDHQDTHLLISQIRRLENSRSVALSRRFSVPRASDK